VAALETAVAAGEPQIVAGLVAAGLRHERRSLRVRVAALQAEFEAPDVLRLTFGLPAGSYATSLLRELMVVVRPALASG
jgi:tRNA pseudouridine13 synthase